jgi:uncharacterized membrane protein YuzA (DUF378 family)
MEKRVYSILFSTNFAIFLKGGDGMRTLNTLSLILLMIGGFNWLLVGLFNWDLFGGISGGMNSAFARIIYVIVGLAAIYALTYFKRVSEDDGTERQRPKP